MRTVGTLRRAAAVIWSLVATWAIAAFVAARLAPRARRLLSTRLARSTTDALGLRMRVTGAVPSDDNDGLKAIYLSGGGAKLAGLRSLLEGTMAVPVRLTEPFRGFSVNKGIDREYLIEAAPYFAVGAGLSIRRPGDR
jgi:cell division ATPase FtsA